MDPSTPQYTPNHQYTQTNIYENQQQAQWNRFSENVAFNHPLIAPSFHGLPVGQVACQELIDALPNMYTNPILKDSSFREWEYEDRRQAQKILPFLYLGPSSVIRDLDFIQREGITFLLAIRDRNRVQAVTVNGDKAAATLGIESDFFDFSSSFEVISQFLNATRRINDHLCPCPTHRTRNSSQSPVARKVLVFCDTGNDKSATIVTAYLMTMYRVTATVAGSHVNIRRSSSHMGTTLWDSLLTFETILDARRTVAANASSQPDQSGKAIDSNQSPSRKRFFESAFDASAPCATKGNDSIQEADDHPRPPQAPFRDRHDN